MSQRNPFNPQYYGYAPSTQNQLFAGSAPYVYNYLPNDSKSCITAKHLYNAAHSNIYSPDNIVRSHPAGALIQSFGLKQHEANIKQHCMPSFKYDEAPPQMNNLINNYGSNNYGTNNFG